MHVHPCNSKTKHRIHVYKEFPTSSTKQQCLDTGLPTHKQYTFHIMEKIKQSPL